MYIRLPDTGNQPDQDTWTCGACSAARVLRHKGHDVDYGSVKGTFERQSLLPFGIDLKFGISPSFLRETMKKWEGENVKLERETNFPFLCSLVQSGKPVIALLRVGTDSKFPIGTFPLLHWLCVTGIADRMVHVTDTDGSVGWMNENDFKDQWEWHVGAGAVSAALDTNGVLTRTIVWVDR